MLSISQVASLRLYKPAIECWNSVKWIINKKILLSNHPTRVKAHHSMSLVQKNIDFFLGTKHNLQASTKHAKCLNLSAGWCISRKDYMFPEVVEDELEERFVRGSGPGGQSVNKTANCVTLKHIPTGIVVKCHETRSLDTNRKRARERLRERLDLHMNGENSFISLQQKEDSNRKAEKKRRTRQRLEMKKSFKEEIRED